MPQALYRLSILAVAAMLGYVCVVVTLANIAAPHSPAFVLRLQPGHAVANARLGDLLIATNPSRSQIALAAGHGVTALRHNPTLPAAARLVAMQAALRGDEAQAAMLFDYAAAMSKRDIPTQFWLLERRVAQNDVSGALSHFGIALQVAPGTRELLFPVLTSALSERHLVVPIARLVRGGDSWRPAFLYHVAEHAANPRHAAALYLALAALGQPPAPDHLAPLIGRLIAASAYDQAARLYALVDREWRRGDVNAQLDGGFARAGDFPPLGWTVNPDTAYRGARPDRSDDIALHINLPASGRVWAARRLLLLPAGRYDLSGRVGAAEGRPAGRVRVGLACLQEQEPATYAEAPLVNGAIRGSVATPPGCPVQWLSIGVETQAGTPGGSAWVDELRLAPAR